MMGMASPETMSRRKGVRLEQEVEQEATEARVSNSCRAKKSKNGAKKVPQRGLGVAQLEKLRLQEQKLQESASFAAARGLRGLPFSGTIPVTEQGGFYGSPHSTMDRKLEICSDRRGTNLLSLCKMLPSWPKAVAGPVSADLVIPQSRRLYDSVFRAGFKNTLSSPDLISVSSLKHRLRSSFSTVLAEHAERNDAATQSSYLGAFDTSSLDSSLSSCKSGRDHSNGKSAVFEKENSTVGVTEADAAKILSLSVLDASTSHGILFELQSASRMDKESVQDKRVQEEFPLLHFSGESFKNVGYTGLMKRSAVCTPEQNGSLSNLQLLSSSLDPPDICYTAVDQLHLPTMRVSSFGEMPKELSSFQNRSSGHVQASPEKLSERKRPWLAMQHPTLFDVKLKDSGETGPQGFDEHVKRQAWTAQPLECNAICSSAQGILWVPLFQNGSCPDPPPLLDVKKNAGKEKGNSNYNIAIMDSGLQTLANTFLSLGTSSPARYDTFLQKYGCSEHPRIQHDLKELQEVTSWKETAKEQKGSFLLTEEPTDVILLEHCFMHCSSKIKQSSITLIGKSEDGQAEEECQSGVSYKHRSLDLSLKLAI